MDGRKYLRDLTTVEVPLGQLHGYEGNAKEHTRGQLDAVEASIREFGFSNPVLAWHDAGGRAVIVAGHARCEAARALGMDRVPVIFLDGLSDAQRRALTLADNQTTMMTGWDDGQLAEELDMLMGEFDMGDFGFDADALGDAFEPPADDGEPELSEAVAVFVKFPDVESYSQAIDAITVAAQAAGGTVGIR